MAESTRDLIARAVAAAAARSDDLYVAADQFDLMEDPDCADLLGRLLTDCVAARFTLPLDLNAVAEFASSFVAGFDTEDRPPQLYIEAAVRAGAGEAELLAELPPEIVVHLMLVAVAAMLGSDAQTVHDAAADLLSAPLEPATD